MPLLREFLYHLVLFSAVAYLVLSDRNILPRYSSSAFLNLVRSIRDRIIVSIMSLERCQTVELHQFKVNSILR